MIEPQVRYAIGLWSRVGLDILEDLDVYDWEMSIRELAQLFTYHFRNYQIIFTVNDSPNNLRKYVDCATFFEDAAIEVFLRPASIRYLKKIRFSKEDYMLRWMDFRRNIFLLELIQVLSHELLHRKQWELGGVDDSKESINKDDWEYLSFPEEIQTHAQDTAFCVLYNREGIWKEFYVNLYRYTFGNDSYQFKRFMKMVQKFLERMKQDQIDLLP